MSNLHADAIEAHPGSGRRNGDVDSGWDYQRPRLPDLIIAATSEVANLTVLHVDKGFELISEVTGRAVERLSLWRQAVKTKRCDRDGARAGDVQAARGTGCGRS